MGVVCIESGVVGEGVLNKERVGLVGDVYSLPLSWSTTVDNGCPNTAVAMDIRHK